MTQAVERTVAGHLEEPGGRVVRHAAKRPRLQGRDERILHGVLGELQVARAKRARQGSHELAALTPEQVIDEAR